MVALNYILNKGARRTIFVESKCYLVASILAAFVFAFCKSQTMPIKNSFESTFETNSDVFYVNKCQKDKEYHCRSEDKCIPIEWLCDFNEQCLDGEDEFGCSPEWCTFEHNLCNWKNEFKGLREDRSLIAWRKYHSSVEQSAKAKIEVEKPAKSQIGHKDVAKSPSYINQLIQDKLVELKSKATPNTSFIFAPIITTNNNLLQMKANYEAQFDIESGHKTRRANLIKSSSFKSPLISQTNSMCELRFKYALWAKLVSSIKEEPFKIILTMEVKLYEHFSQSFNTSTSTPTPAYSQTLSDESNRVNRAKVLWSKSIESSSDLMPSSVASSSLKPESPFGSEEAEWLVDVVELGHLRQVEIGFDVKLAIISLGDVNAKGIENGPQEKSKAGDEKQNPISPSEYQRHKEQVGEMIMKLNSRQQQQQELKGLPHASIVALNWLRFQGCAWPQGKHENSLYLNPSDQMDLVNGQMNQTFRDKLQLSESNPTNNTLTNKRLEEDEKSRRVDLDHGDINININLVDYGVGGQNDEQQQLSVGCRKSEFQCQNSICLEEHRLCNFVNDCMNESPIQSEDEHEDLCRIVPGMEDFESLNSSLGLNSENHAIESDSEEILTTKSAITAEETTAKSLYVSKKLSSFWTLTSNWPIDKINVQNSKISNKLHLPRRDHTLKLAKGHYLSLELPRHNNGFSKTNNIRSSQSGQDNSNVHWTYLSSAWMRKLSSEKGECRIKFFYNVISDKPNIGVALQRGQMFKIYLAVEHFIAKEKETQDNEFQGSTRKIDRLIQTHLKDYEDSNLFGRDSLIEYPGVDFWREFNYELVGLEEGDLFYARIAIIVENLGEDGHSYWHRTTINIDDLSTHFGCSLISKKEHERVSPLQMAHKENDPLRLSDYVGAKDKSAKLLEYYNLVRRKRTSTGVVEFEPHKLIIGVVVVLSSIAGLILIIVYIVVPYVERVVISYHDQLTVGLSGIGSTPRHSTENITNACELTTTESDWEQVSRRWRRTNNGNTMTDNEVTVLNL